MRLLLQLGAVQYNTCSLRDITMKKRYIFCASVLYISICYGAAKSSAPVRSQSSMTEIPEIFGVAHKKGLCAFKKGFADGAYVCAIAQTLGKQITAAQLQSIANALYEEAHKNKLKKFNPIATALAPEKRTFSLGPEVATHLTLATFVLQGRKLAHDSIYVKELILIEGLKPLGSKQMFSQGVPKKISGKSCEAEYIDLISYPIKVLLGENSSLDQSAEAVFDQSGMEGKEGVVVIIDTKAWMGMTKKKGLFRR